MNTTYRLENVDLGKEGENDGWFIETHYEWRVICEATGQIVWRCPYEHVIDNSEWPERDYWTGPRHVEIVGNEVRAYMTVSGRTGVRFEGQEEKDAGYDAFPLPPAKVASAQDSPLRNAIANLVKSENTGVLALGGPDGDPYAALVAFLPSDDLTELFFATLRSTRKYARVLVQPRIALLIDSRRRCPDDFSEAATLTAFGKAAETCPAERPSLSGQFAARVPALADFLANSDCAIFRIRVEKYLLVEKFQQVSEWFPGAS